VLEKKRKKDPWKKKKKKPPPRKPPDCIISYIPRTAPNQRGLFALSASQKHTQQVDSLPACGGAQADTAVADGVTRLNDGGKKMKK
jgi:hypothetical protein